jgi:hypothetical protein
MSTTLDEGRVGELSGQVSGLVVSPHDAGYDEARAIHNGLVDRRPALIVRCPRPLTWSPRSSSRAAQGSRCRSGAAATTSPAAP